MKFLSDILRSSRTARSGIAVGLLAGFALAFALAVSPQLHERVHHEADQAQHHCLAVLLHAGHLQDAPMAAANVAPLPVDFAAAIVALDRAVAPLFLGTAVLEHAPPVSLLA